jgi:hypothetical protein
VAVADDPDTNMGKRKPRVKTSISVAGEDFEPFRQWCEDNGRIQGDMLGRVLRWFVVQKKPVWRCIVDRIEEEPEVRKAYAEVLKRMAEELVDTPAGRGATSRGNSIEVHAR